MPTAAVAVSVALYSVRCGAVGRPSISVAIGIPVASIVTYRVRCGAVGRPSELVESEIVVSAVSIAVGVPQATRQR